MEAKTGSFLDLLKKNEGSLCVYCKGSRMLCGKNRCPLLVKFYTSLNLDPLISMNIAGSSPPGVFVGRYGYPYVYAGPLIPPIHGDTSLLDTPELWIGKSIDDIVDFRFKLVRGKQRIYVKNVEAGGKIIDATRELAMAINPIDIEAEFLKKPATRLVLDDEVQPFGPSAPLKNLDLGTLKIDQRIEKAYSDTDLRAREAVLDLYKAGTLVSKIQRAFSVGAFGERKNRRFVPTRWSITAVDSIISTNLMDKVRGYPIINEYRIYESRQLDTRWIVLMLPREWSYELIEAWYPETAWNPGKNIVIYSDSEAYEGRTTYAQIGGCYYAARLALAEHLCKEKRQARVIILRETHPGYIMPVGVWNVRENVREALRNQPTKFNTLEEAFTYISKKLDIGIETWIQNSTMLRDALHQKRLIDFIARIPSTQPEAH